MQLIQTISMDFAVHGVAPRVFGKQDDSLSRLVRISLSNNGVAWAIPSDAIFMLRYRTPSGGVGLYDTLPDGSSAFSVAGNAVTVALVDQIFAAAGVAECDLRIISDGAGASTWTFLVEVDRGPTGDNIVSSDYINVLTAVASQVAADADRAQRAANSVDTSNLMNRLSYDPALAVKNAGGIPAYVNSAISGIDVSGIKYSTGYYTGDGTIKTIEIVFNFTPILVVVTPFVKLWPPVIFHRGVNTALLLPKSDYLERVSLSVTWSNKSMSFKGETAYRNSVYGSSPSAIDLTAEHCLNHTNYEYKWTAIGI